MGREREGGGIERARDPDRRGRIGGLVTSYLSDCQQG